MQNDLIFLDCSSFCNNALEPLLFFVFWICLIVYLFRLYKLCSNHSVLKEQGLRFVNTIKELLQHLLEYRKIIQSEVKELRMSCIVNLLVRIINSFTLSCDQIVVRLLQIFLLLLCVTLSNSSMYCFKMIIDCHFGILLFCILPSNFEEQISIHT